MLYVPLAEKKVYLGSIKDLEQLYWYHLYLLLPLYSSILFVLWCAYDCIWSRCRGLAQIWQSVSQFMILQDQYGSLTGNYRTLRVHPA